MSKRIDHAQLAATLRNNIRPDEMADEDTGNWLAAAQVHATLALVEQQRIANLIQLMHVPVGGLSEEIKSALHAAFHDNRDWEAELHEGVIET